MAERLVFNSDCKQNLIAYLNKPEIKAFKNIGIALNLTGLRSLLQLIAEKRFQGMNIIAFTFDNNAKLIQLNTSDEIENFIEMNYKKQIDEVFNKVQQLNAMTREERWDFWVDELKDCIKCYACRSVCPMCYCEECTLESPNFLNVGTLPPENPIFHLTRALHMAGRCIDCGLCDMTCPDFCFQWEQGTDKRGRAAPVLLGIDYAYCKGCMKCVEVCPVEALVKVEETEDMSQRAVHLIGPPEALSSFDREGIIPAFRDEDESYWHRIS